MLGLAVSVVVKAKAAFVNSVKDWKVQLCILCVEGRLAVHRFVAHFAYISCTHRIDSVFLEGRVSV